MAHGILKWGTFLDMNEDLIPLNHIARRLRVPVRWLKCEAIAGRVPALDAGGVLLANPDAVRATLPADVWKMIVGVVKVTVDKRDRG